MADCAVMVREAGHYLHRPARPGDTLCWPDGTQMLAHDVQDWDEITGKPLVFPPSTHTHAYSDLTGIPATFAPAAHTHPQSEVTGLIEKGIKLRKCINVGIRTLLHAETTDILDLDATVPNVSLVDIDAPSGCSASIASHTVTWSAEKRVAGQAIPSTGMLVATAGLVALQNLMNTLGLSASTTARASLNLPHGAAPSAPVDGDVWSTTVGLFVRVNGSTVGPLS